MQNKKLPQQKLTLKGRVLLTTTQEATLQAILLTQDTVTLIHTVPLIIMDQTTTIHTHHHIAMDLALAMVPVQAIILGYVLEKGKAIAVLTYHLLIKTLTKDHITENWEH